MLWLAHQLNNMFDNRFTLCIKYCAIFFIFGSNLGHSAVITFDGSSISLGTKTFFFWLFKKKKQKKGTFPV